MDTRGFENFYLNSTRVGSKKDSDHFFDAFYSVLGYNFFNATPGDVRSRMSTLCTKIKTKMLSNGCQAKDATRVISAYKKWFKDMYD